MAFAIYALLCLPLIVLLAFVGFGFWYAYRVPFISIGLSVSLAYIAMTLPWLVVWDDDGLLVWLITFSCGVLSFVLILGVMIGWIQSGRKNPFLAGAFVSSVLFTFIAITITARVTPVEIFGEPGQEWLLVANSPTELFIETSSISRDPPLVRFWTRSGRAKVTENGVEFYPYYSLLETNCSSSKTRSLWNDYALEVRDTPDGEKARWNRLQTVWHHSKNPGIQWQESEKAIKYRWQRPGNQPSQWHKNGSENIYNKYQSVCDEIKQ